jgi:tetratricopeptide (TPR) repeat protein
MSILRTMGFNRERILEDDDAALEAYREITNSTKNNGSAEYYYGVQGATRILTRHGKFDEALEVLNLVDIGKLSGSWRGSMLLARAQSLAAAGRKDEASEAYRGVLADESALKAHREAATEAIRLLEAGRKKHSDSKKE